MIKTIDVPGFGPDDLAVTVQGELLTIRGSTDTGRHLHRNYWLPHADCDVTAALEHGVLTLALANPAERTIPISVSST